MSCYSCPIQEDHPTCEGCFMLTKEEGKFWCHYASPNFIYSDKAEEKGVFPVIFPERVFTAEVRFVNENGKRVSQINIGDLEGKPATCQGDIEAIKAAWDSKPLEQKYFMRRKDVH